MGSHPSWNKWRQEREHRLPIVFESKGQRPDYSFDSWLKMTQSFGDDISSFVTNAKEKDQELDADLKKNKQKQPEKKDDGKDDEDRSEEKETTWKRLREIAKERREEEQKKTETKSVKKP